MPGPAYVDRTVVARGLGRFQTRRGWLQIAFWAEATLILVVPFLLYALVRSWRAVPVIPLSFVAKLFLGSIGGTAAAGGMLFDDAMRSFALGLKRPPAKLRECGSCAGRSACCSARLRTIGSSTGRTCVKRGLHQNGSCFSEIRLAGIAMAARATLATCNTICFSGPSITGLNPWSGGCSSWIGEFDQRFRIAS